MKVLLKTLLTLKKNKNKILPIVFHSMSVYFVWYHMQVL